MGIPQDRGNVEVLLTAGDVRAWPASSAQHYTSRIHAIRAALPQGNAAMTETTRSSEGVVPQTAQSAVRSCHEGPREMDLIFGPFADAEIGASTRRRHFVHEEPSIFPSTERLPLADRPTRGPRDQDRRYPGTRSWPSWLGNDFLKPSHVPGSTPPEPRHNAGRFRRAPPSSTACRKAMRRSRWRLSWPKPDRPGRIRCPRRASGSALIVEALGFVAPDLPVLEFPAWNCLPYDRVSACYRPRGRAPPGRDGRDRVARPQEAASRRHADHCQRLLQRMPTAESSRRRPFARAAATRST